jgi:hypothetical protein
VEDPFGQAITYVAQFQTEPNPHKILLALIIS